MLEGFAVGTRCFVCKAKIARFILSFQYTELVYEEMHVLERKTRDWERKPRLLEPLHPW